MAFVCLIFLCCITRTVYTGIDGLYIHMTDYLMIGLNKYLNRWNEKFCAVLRMRGEKIEKKKNM